jgi:hypothetical protein
MTKSRYDDGDTVGGDRWWYPWLWCWMIRVEGWPMRGNKGWIMVRLNKLGDR